MRKTIRVVAALAMGWAGSMLAMPAGAHSIEGGPVYHKTGGVRIEIGGFRNDHYGGGHYRDDFHARRRHDPYGGHAKPRHGHVHKHDFYRYHQRRPQRFRSHRFRGFRGKRHGHSSRHFRRPRFSVRDR